MLFDLDDKMLADFERLKELNYAPSKTMRELFAKYGDISPWFQFHSKALLRL